MKIKDWILQKIIEFIDDKLDHLKQVFVAFHFY